MGRHAVHALRAEGRPVRALVRRRAAADLLEAWGCEVVVGDVRDAASLRAACAGCAAACHLVAIISGRAADFERVLVGGTGHLVEAAAAAGVGRIALVSALGVGPGGAVPYYRAKWEAEQLVRGSGIPHAILRPSFVFGRDGGALPRFARIVRRSPLTPVVGPGTQRVQPLWVEDLARALLLALDRADGRLVELGGPDVVDWNELWRRIARALGRTRAQVHLPIGLLRPAAALLELLPSPPLTRDQLTMLSLGDNVVGDGGSGMRELGLAGLVPLDEQLRRALA